MIKKGKLFTIIFFLGITLPLFDMFFHFSPVKELFEKRIPVENPKIEFSKNYAKNFEKYFNDNYGFRKTLISANSNLADKIFNESPDARAVVGKDGWFYFDNCDALLDSIGKAEISDKLIENGAENFYQNWQILKSKNIDYLLVIAADKSTVYPEFLPKYMKPKGPHRMDKFVKALRKIDKDFPILDLRPLMLEAKKKEIIYHKTDTHWNKRGAHSAYVEIAKNFKIKPYLRDSFEAISSGRMRGDISDIMGVDTSNINYDLKQKFISNYSLIMAPDLLSEFHKPNATYNKNSNLPNLFVYKDSYFAELTPLIANHFSKAYYINESPCDIDYKIIKDFHPNVLIHQFWEGRIEKILNRCSS